MGAMDTNYAIKSHPVTDYFGFPKSGSRTRICLVAFAALALAIAGGMVLSHFIPSSIPWWAVPAALGGTGVLLTGALLLTNKKRQQASVVPPPQFSPPPQLPIPPEPRKVILVPDHLKGAQVKADLEAEFQGDITYYPEDRLETLPAEVSQTIEGKDTILVYYRQGRFGCKLPQHLDKLANHCNRVALVVLNGGLSIKQHPRPERETLQMSVDIDETVQVQISTIQIAYRSFFNSQGAEDLQIATGLPKNSIPWYSVQNPVPISRQLSAPSKPERVILVEDYYTGEKIREALESGLNGRVTHFSRHALTKNYLAEEISQTIKGKDALLVWVKSGRLPEFLCERVQILARHCNRVGLVILNDRETGLGYHIPSASVPYDLIENANLSLLPSDIRIKRPLSEEDVHLRTAEELDVLVAEKQKQLSMN